MNETDKTAAPSTDKGPSIHHKAAKYVGVALAGGFIMNFLFNAAFKGSDPAVARIAGIVPGLFFWSAFPSGIIALWGIRKHGCERRLLVSGLAGVIIPPLLSVMAFAAFAQVRDSSRQMFLQNVAQEMSKSSPKMIDEITRLDGAVIEQDNRLIISITIISLNADEIDRELWTKNAVPAFRTAFAQTKLLPLVQNGALVIYRYYGKDKKLIDELVYAPKDFPKK